MHPGLAAILAKPIAHRGLHGVETGCTENSFEAAEAAVAAGFGIECDVQISADGEAIVFHDAQLDRLTHASGALASLSAASLAAIPLRDGAAIPTLQALLASIAGRAPLVIEIKGSQDDAPRLAARVVALTQIYAGPVAVKSFNAATVVGCRRSGARCPLGLVGPSEQATAFDGIEASSPDFLSWRIDALAALRVRQPKVPLMSWTIRTAAEAAEAAAHAAQIVFEHYQPDGSTTR